MTSSLGAPGAGGDDKRTGPAAPVLAMN